MLAHSPRPNGAAYLAPSLGIKKIFRMRIQQNVSKFIYVLCVFLAMAFWLVFFSTRMDNFAKTVYVFFLPLTATPYIMWVIHKEGQEPEGYLKEVYGGYIGLMWFGRIFMIVVVSTLGSITALLLLGAIGLIASLF
jgi:hypothetical protein